jgi:hypothetical protein
MIDPLLGKLAGQRREMLRIYAHLMPRFGPSHSDRSKLNATRAKKRKEVRRKVKENGALIIARVMQLTEIR